MRYECRMCHQLKDEREFHKVNGLHREARCRECSIAYHQQYFQRIKGSPVHRENQLKSKARHYNIPLEEMRKLVQQKRCNCCGSVKDKLMVDHDHTSGKFRGMICVSCNIILGHVKDDPKNLMKLLAYLGGR